MVHLCTKLAHFFGFGNITCLNGTDIISIIRQQYDEAKVLSAISMGL